VVVVEQEIVMDQDKAMVYQQALVVMVERGLLALDRLVTVVLVMVAVVVL
jgi:hypothetical protein